MAAIAVGAVDFRVSSVLNLLSISLQNRRRFIMLKQSKYRSSQQFTL